MSSERGGAKYSKSGAEELSESVLEASGGAVVAVAGLGERLLDTVLEERAIAPERLVAKVLRYLDLVADEPAQAARAAVLSGWREAAIGRRAGEFATTEEVAAACAVTAQTVRNHTEQGRFIAYEPPAGRGLRFRLWQFAAPGQPHAWVPEVVAAYGHNGLGLVDFLTVRRQSGRTHLERLQAGEIAPVLAAARRANKD